MGKPIDLDQQVKRDQDYWRVVNEPTKIYFLKMPGTWNSKQGFIIKVKRTASVFAPHWHKPG